MRDFMTPCVGQDRKCGGRSFSQETHAMPTYVTLVKWTEQGAKGARDTVKRAREFRSDVERRGGKVHSFHWTQGQYDLVTVIEFPDEQTGMAELLAIASLGNVKSETLRAFNESEMEAIIKKI
jgi:uncharacterized protein with GYD domain